MSPPESGRHKRFYRHRLLFDEQFLPRKYFTRINSRFGIKHIVHDYHKPSLSDLEIYQFALKQERLIVTLNVKHFQRLIDEGDKTGIIGVTGNLRFDQIDKKLSSLLLESHKKELFGKLTKI